MDKKEELLLYFEKEIQEVSQKEISVLACEIEDIRKRTMEELKDSAEREATMLYEQEVTMMNSDHAIALSHVNDDNNRKLMKERDGLVDQIFTEAKAQIVAFRKSAEYVKKLKQKLEVLKERQLSPAVLYVNPEDESLLQELLEAYALPCDGQCDITIQIGGFRLVCNEQGIIVDETYDEAILEARSWFCETSGMTIR